MITIYDTSLRDGLQGEKVNLNLSEKLLAVVALDKLGIHYIEGGFPLASEKEMSFFKEVKKLKLKHSIITAFGSTRKPGKIASKDEHINALLEAQTKAITIVGKTWTRHVTEVLKTDLEENLRMIHDSVSYLKSKKKEVIYDGEHFFDGFKENPDYAMKTLETALSAGADWVIPCDTNGGIDYDTFIAALKSLSQLKSKGRYGVHLHNDTESAVAFSMLSLKYGSEQIQGTINGWGERCGNTNLVAVIGNIHFKTNSNVFTSDQVKNLTYVSHYMDELANLMPNDKQAYVGRSAFAHKAGQHADVVIKNPKIMEHLDSKKVGNDRRILLSELAGKSTLLLKLARFGKFDKNSSEVIALTKVLKEREQFGYEYEAAEGSFDLLIRKELKAYRPLFDKVEYRVDISKEEKGTHAPSTWAFIKLRVGKEDHLGDAEGVGPVGALDAAFRNAMSKKFSFIKSMKLDDFKVRVLNSSKAYDAQVRVLIKSSIHHRKYLGRTWGTVGVSENLIDASWQALRDSYEYALNEFKL